MSRHTSKKLQAYAVLASLALVAAIAFGEAGLAALGAPFAVALVAGLVTARDAAPRLRASITPERPEVHEGERLEVRIELCSDDLDGRCDIGLALPAGLSIAEGDLTRAAVVRSGGSAEMTAVLTADRWGAYTFGPLAVRVREPGGLFTWEGRVGEASSLRVRPLRAPTRTVVRAYTVGSAAGEHVSRARAEGIEFADLREYVPGDRATRINWRVSARRGALYVNDHHPERNNDVVLFVDTFSERGLPDTIRIASVLADAYLRHHDRVGLVSFGGVLSWVEPGGGPRQRERLDEALLGSESYASFAWKSLDTIPARILPARCLVVAVSPLVDERTRTALATMAIRRLDLAVIEVPLAVGDGAPRTWYGRLAERIYAMQHQDVRDRFLSLGVAVVPWDAATGAEAALLAIESYRRRSAVRMRR